MLPYKKQLSTKKRFYTELRWAKWIFASPCLPPTSLGMANRLRRVDGEGSVSRAELSRIAVSSPGLRDLDHAHGAQE